MKKIAYFTLVLICVVLMGCDNNSPQNSPADVNLPIVGMTIVKMTAPKYLDYVVCDKETVFPDLAEGNFEESVDVYSIRGYGGCVQELYLGTNPYIALENGYYLVDWKWGNYIYPPTNKLMSIKWTDVEDRLQQWDLQTEVLASSWRDFFEFVSYTDRKSVDIFLQIDSLPKFVLANISKDQYDPFNSSYYFELNSLSQIKDPIFLSGYLDEAKRQDSLQMVYVERLRQVIRKNGLKEVSYIF